MSSLLNNFFVNTFTGILQNATRLPTEEDVNNLHAMIDQVAGQMGINSNDTTNTNNDTSEQQHSIHCNDGSNINNDDANSSGRPALSSTTTSNVKQSSSAISSTAATSSNHQRSNNNTASASTTAFVMNTVQETPTTKRRRGKRDRDKISTLVEGTVNDPSLPQFVTDVESLQYPNGDIEYKVNGVDHQIAYATCQYTGYTSKRTGVQSSSKYCLGSYECTVEGCELTKRPQLPTGRKKGLPPKPLKEKNRLCKTHNVELVHVPCTATMIVSKFPTEGYCQVIHKGSHNHRRPAPIHLSQQGAEALSQAVRNNPGASPMSLLVGTEHRPGLHTKDQALTNIGRLRKLRRQELQELVMEAPDEIASYGQSIQMDIITESSLRMSDGCVIMQTDIMRQIMNDSKEPNQTDTVEGFAMSHDLPAMNLTITSTYCHVQEKWVPTQFGILFGKTAEHYTLYFLTLFKHMSFDSLDDFIQSYSGMVCDFSEAERVGFRRALEDGFKNGVQQRFPRDDVEHADKCKYFIDRLYACCTIHFERSATRVRMNHGVVPVQRKEEFKEVVTRLTVEKDTDKFQADVAYLKKEFKRCTPWLDWYLHPDRAKLIFPACANHDFVGTSRNTNAQESMGRTIQQTCTQDNPNFKQLYIHLFKFCHRIDAQYSMALKHGPEGIKYGEQRKRVKRAVINDGRPQDNNGRPLDKNLATPKRTGAGRPKNATNLAPSGKSLVNLELALRWGLEVNIDNKLIKGTNTCPWDTILQALFFLQKYDDDLCRPIRKQRMLKEVMNLIQEGEYHLARYKWIIHTLEKDPGVISRTVNEDNAMVDVDEAWDCGGGIEGAIQCAEIFRFEVGDDYDGCSNGDVACPNFDAYQTPMDCLGIRQKRSNYIPVPTDKLHTMQAYLDETYNTWGVTVPCGHGLKNYKAGATNDAGEVDVTVIDDDGVRVEKRSLNEEELASEMCDGNQKVRKCMGSNMPKLVMIERSCRDWEQGLTIERNSKLTSINKIEKQLIINDHRYLLVQINLGNGSHWVGITVIKGCYLLYDGLPQKKLEWVKADMKFDTISSCGGNYRVESMFYKDVGESVSEDEVKEGSAHGDDGEATADVGEDDIKYLV